MTTFLTSLLLFAALLAALGAPLWCVAYRVGRRTTIKNFFFLASGIAFAGALMAAISERQMAQCRAAGNPACFDYGTTGMQMVMVFFFVVAAWWSAYSIWRG